MMMMMKTTPIPLKPSGAGAKGGITKIAAPPPQLKLRK